MEEGGPVLREPLSEEESGQRQVEQLIQADRGWGVGKGTRSVQQGFLEEKNEGMREGRDREAEEPREETWSQRVIQCPGKMRWGLRSREEEGPSP